MTGSNGGQEGVWEGGGTGGAQTSAARGGSVQTQMVVSRCPATQKVL